MIGYDFSLSTRSIKLLRANLNLEGGGFPYKCGLRILIWALNAIEKKSESFMQSVRALSNESLRRGARFDWSHKTPKNLIKTHMKRHQRGSCCSPSWICEACTIIRLKKSESKDVRDAGNQRYINNSLGLFGASQLKGISESINWNMKSEGTLRLKWMSFFSRGGEQTFLWRN